MGTVNNIHFFIFRILHNIKGSKSGIIELKENNSTPSIAKGKNKNLIVCG